MTYIYVTLPGKTVRFATFCGIELLVSADSSLFTAHFGGFLCQLDVLLPRYEQKHFITSRTLEMRKCDFIALIAFSVHFHVTFNNHMKFKPHLHRASAHMDLLDGAITT